MLQVLCSNSALDSSEYWLRNEKSLCRLGLLDDDTEGSCIVVSNILWMMKCTCPFGNKDGQSYVWCGCVRRVCGTEMTREVAV